MLASGEAPGSPEGNSTIEDVRVRPVESGAGSSSGRGPGWALCTAHPVEGVCGAFHQDFQSPLLGIFLDDPWSPGGQVPRSPTHRSAFSWRLMSEEKS